MGSLEMYVIMLMMMSELLIFGDPSVGRYGSRSLPGVRQSWPLSRSKTSLFTSGDPASWKE